MISNSGADSKSTRCGSVMRSRPAPSSNASMGKVRAKVFKPLRRFANTPKAGVRSVMRLMICSERCCRKSSLVASACLPDACHWASSLALRLAYMRSSSLRTSLFSSAVSIARTSTTSLAICSFILLLFLYETTTGQTDCDVLSHFRPTQRGTKQQNLQTKKNPTGYRRGFLLLRITSLTITYFHTGCSTIIGAKLFHGPVRDGKGWDQLAMVIRHNLYWHLSSMERQSLNLEEAKIG